MKKTNGVRKVVDKMDGITLIALVITIIVLLILSGISISLVVGENGILEQTQNSKVETEIASEKEYIGLAVSAIKMQKDNTITVEKLQKELDNSMGENTVEVTECGKGFEVFIIAKNRYHEVEEDGKITGMEYVVEIEHAGDITKGGTLDGSESKPYEISCIEDLVTFSNMSRGSGVKIVNGTVQTITSGNNFSGKTVILTKDLNFLSRYSYENYERTDFGDINGNTEDGNGLMNEMTTGTGFKPINSFGGTFDGKENYLKNIYIDESKITVSSDNATGLFRKIGASGIVQNLNISGKIVGVYNVGGIASKGEGVKLQIINCNNYAKVEGVLRVGGIMAEGTSIENCNNYGEIVGTYEIETSVGGITGRNGKINNCINYGTISGEQYIGGIVGMNNAGYVEKSINFGKITANSASGGITGCCGNGGIVNQCYNAGKIYGNNEVGGITGFFYRKSYILDSYNIGKVFGENYVGGISGKADPYTNTSSNCYNIGEISGTRNIGSAFGTKNATSLIEYMYYLNSLPYTGAGNTSDADNVVEGKSKEELCSDEMIELLNQNSSSENTWIKDTNNINNGYPILSWQVE